MMSTAEPPAPKKSKDSGTHEIATLSTTDIADALGVTAETVRRWIEDGRIEPDVVTFGRHARFRPSSVEKLRRRMRASG